MEDKNQIVLTGRLSRTPKWHKDSFHSRLEFRGGSIAISAFGSVAAQFEGAELGQLVKIVGYLKCYVAEHADGSTSWQTTIVVNAVRIDASDPDPRELKAWRYQ